MRAQGGRRRNELRSLGHGLKCHSVQPVQRTKAQFRAQVEPAMAVFCWRAADLCPQPVSDPRAGGASAQFDPEVSVHKRCTRS